MNRRSFLRGAVSVMAVAAVLKGRNHNIRLAEPDLATVSPVFHVDPGGFTTLYYNRNPMVRSQGDGSVIWYGVAN